MSGSCILINGQNVYSCKVPEYPTDNKIFVISRIDDQDLENITWVIEDKFGHKYIGESELDGDGNFEIDLTGLPDELLTRHSGNFMLSISKNVDASCDLLNFKFCDIDEDITISFVQFSMYKTNEPTEAYIGCICDDPEVIPGEGVGNP